MVEEEKKTRTIKYFVSKNVASADRFTGQKHCEENFGSSCQRFRRIPNVVASCYACRVSLCPMDEYHMFDMDLASRFDSASASIAGSGADLCASNSVDSLCAST